MRLITASRRTDLPAFYTPWLVNRLKAGHAHSLNPVAGQVYRISLLPEDVAAIALFTRDPGPLLPHLPALMDAGYHFYAHVTLNGYPRMIEPSSPSIEHSAETVAALSDLLGPKAVVWRYDPILLSDQTPEAWHLARFEGLARKLEGSTGQVYVSFVDPYRKTDRNLANAKGLDGLVIGDTERDRALGAELAEIARRYGMTLKACAEQSLAGIAEEGHCADAEMVASLRPDLDVKLRKSATRTGCGCCESTDLGAYHTCAFGCAYCYATESVARGVRRMREHDPEDSLLWRPGHLRGVDLAEVEIEPRDTGTATKEGALF